MQHLIAEADKVLRYLVMFLPVLFALDLQNEIQPLSTFFAFLAGLFIGLRLRNAPLDKKKSEIIIKK